MTQKTIEEQTRLQIAHILPHAIQAAMNSYQLFLDNEKDTASPKSFKAHHDACKVALAHVALLIRMAQWADVPDPDIAEGAQKELLMSLIEGAKSDIEDPA